MFFSLAEASDAIKISLERMNAHVSLVTHFESQSDEIGGSPDAQLSFDNGARVGDGLVGDTQ